MQVMFRFFKEIYLTGFAIIFRLSRAKDIDFKVGAAIAVITLVEWFFFEGLRGYIDIFLNRIVIVSKPVVIITFFALFFVNQYVLTIRGHGIKFAHGFDSLDKCRRIVLVVSFAALSAAAIAFGICGAIAHRHFIGAN